MITSTAFAGKHFAVLGLARSGRATVDALLASGARVTAWDSNPEAVENLRSSRAKSRDAAPRVSTALDTNGLVFADIEGADLTPFDSIVVTPGLPLNRHSIAQRARDAGVEIIGDLELFARARAELPPHKVVGITGTNGKSTTTALVHHILKTAGVPSLMGGNIGLPILAQDPLPESGVYVLELSSYQLDLTQTLDCDIAVLLNITPDHLDRYASFEAYAASKARLIEMQSSDQVWIQTEDKNANTLVYARLSEEAQDRSITATHATDQGSVWMRDGLAVGRHGRVGFQGNWPSLPGPHNAQNAVCAIAVCERLGVGPGMINEGLRTYPGLPHRMERVLDRHGVLFVNDSKATNAEAAAPALAAYDRVRWIVGGQAKGESLGDTANELDHVIKAYAIGEAGAMFARLLHEAKIEVTECGTLERAVNQAAAEAEPGETILLSPACASFDQFKDYEARGDAFRAAVEAL